MHVCIIYFIFCYNFVLLEKKKEREKRRVLEHNRRSCYVVRKCRENIYIYIYLELLFSLSLTLTQSLIHATAGEGRSAFCFFVLVVYPDDFELGRRKRMYGHQSTTEP
jgi:hypothetical protein